MSDWTEAVGGIFENVALLVLSQFCETNLCHYLWLL